MKLNLNILALTLIVLASSNVKSAEGDYEEVVSTFFFANWREKIDLLKNPNFHKALTSSDFRKKAWEVAKNSKMATAKNTAKVAVPAAVVYGTYKAYKAGKLDGAIAQTKKQLNSAKSWIMNNKKKVAAGVAAAGFGAISILGYKHAGKWTQGKVPLNLPVRTKVLVSFTAGIQKIMAYFGILNSDSYINNINRKLIGLK